MPNNYFQIYTSESKQFLVFPGKPAALNSFLKNVMKITVMIFT